MSNFDTPVKKEMVAVFGIVQFVAILSTTLFTGAALHVILVEHPARMGSGLALTATGRTSSCRRGMGLQLPLASFGGLTGILAWLMAGGILWVIGAFLIIAAIALTLRPITSTSKQLLDPAQGIGVAGAEALLEKSRRLHLVRGVLSFIASCIYLALVVKT